MNGALICYVTHKDGFSDSGLYFEVYEYGYIIVLKSLRSTCFTRFGISGYTSEDFRCLPKQWKYLTQEEVLLLRADAALKY
jgi:hypothetical protein